MPPIQIATLQGDAHAMGLGHGRVHAEQIAALTEGRVRQCYDKLWAGDASWPAGFHWAALIFWETGLWRSCGVRGPFNPAIVDGT